MYVSATPHRADRRGRAEQRAHVYARGPGVSPRLYPFVRMLATILLRGWFRFSVTGTEHVPADGPAIVAPNHKNFLDPFFVGLALHRQVRFMAKAELLRSPIGWLLNRLGAFPVRRGAADADTLTTARAILAAGGLVVMFPEGTRIADPDALGSPHHGAGRLALETGVPIVPAAITGTAHLWLGALPKLKRVQIAFLPPVALQAAEDRDEVSELIDERVWPAVRDEYGRLRARPGLIAAGLAALGLGGGLLARRAVEARRAPRLLGVVVPRKLRRGKKPRRLRDRLRPGR